MGGRDGHVLLGLVFCIVGLWHLYNHLKNHVTKKRYNSVPWFPVSYSRYLELYLILIGCFIFTIMELQGSIFDNEGAIRASGLHHIEHVCIAMTFFLHALFAILLDKAKPKPKSHIELGHLIAAIAFTQELLLFHFHSTDHVGLEGQYHLLLQQVVFVCLITTLLSIWLPKSFMVCYIRSLSVILQGLWLIVMGFMLWTPNLAPKGCSFHKDHYGRDVIKCDDHGSLDRGKALVNILFSCFLIGMMAFGVSLYLISSNVYRGSGVMEDDGEEGRCKMEERQEFICGKGVVSIDLED